MRISAGSSAVCSSDLVALQGFGRLGDDAVVIGDDVPQRTVAVGRLGDVDQRLSALHDVARGAAAGCLAHRRIGELEPRRPGETLRADRGSHAAARIDVGLLTGRRLVQRYRAWPAGRQLQAAVLEDDATVGAVFVLALLEAVAARSVGLWKIDAIEGSQAQDRKSQRLNSGR